MREQNDGASRLAKDLRENPALLQSVMGSPDAQELLRTLNRDRDGFRQAVRSAAGGDSADLANRIRAVAQSPDGAALLERIQRTLDRRRHGGV